jgi:CrcB protein
MTLVYVLLGGAAGTAARYGLTGWIQSRAGFGFPVGTLVVNVLGCLLIGFSLRYLEAVNLAPQVRAMVAVGVLGAFTTFSTFGYETVALMEDGAWARAAGYAFGSLALGIAAVYVGVTASVYVLQMRS